MSLEGYAGTAYGVGVDANIITASVMAVLSGINRLLVRHGAANDDGATALMMQAIARRGTETAAA